MQQASHGDGTRTPDHYAIYKGWRLEAGFQACCACCQDIRLRQLWLAVMEKKPINGGNHTALHTSDIVIKGVERETSIPSPGVPR